MVQQQDVTPVKETSELLFTLQVERGFAVEAFKGFWWGKELRADFSRHSRKTSPRRAHTSYPVLHSPLIPVSIKAQSADLGGEGVISRAKDAAGDTSAGPHILSPPGSEHFGSPGSS